MFWLALPEELNRNCLRNYRGPTSILRLVRNMKEKVVISLDNSDLEKLKEIVSSSDEDEALNFLRQSILERIDEFINRPHCVPVFEGSYEPGKKEFFQTKKDFLDNIEITSVRPCIANPEKIRIFAELSDNVSEILPYLNAILPGASFNKIANTLTFKKGGRIINIFPKKISIAKAVDLEDVKEILGWIKNLINDTYEKRVTIEPSYEWEREIVALDIYNLLPKTNCKDCGELTCLAFAVKLLEGEQKFKNCLPLKKEEYKDNYEALKEIVDTLGYEEKE